jgi:hypothetical protein
LPPAVPEFAYERILKTLARHEVRFVVVGAVAAIAQGSPLPTEDVDVTPARDPENLERLAAALIELEARLRVPNDPTGIPFPIDARMLPGSNVWTLRTREGDLDLVFTPAGTQGYDDLRRAAFPIDLGGVEITIASLADVIRSKEAAGRPKDLAALPALRQTLEVIRSRERG